MSDEVPSEDPRLTAARQHLDAMVEERRDNQDEKEEREDDIETMKERLKTVVADNPEADDREKKDLMEPIQRGIEEHGRSIEFLRYNIIDMNRRILAITPMIAQMEAVIARAEQQQRDIDVGQSAKSPKKKKKGTKKKKNKKKKKKGSKKKKKRTVRRKK
jgi:hypothetical protein